MMHQGDHMADAKKMGDGWVFDDGAVLYPSLYDNKGKKVSLGGSPVGYGKLLPGVFQRYELGGTQGQHVVRTPADKVEILHKLAVILYTRKEDRQPLWSTLVR